MKTERKSGELLFENNNTRSGDYEKQRAIPRPGHSDFTAYIKFGGYQDYRGGGHFSGRLTVCLVAAGVIAPTVLTNSVGVGVNSSLGGRFAISHTSSSVTPHVNLISPAGGFGKIKYTNTFLILY